MAFDRLNFSPVGSQSRRGHSPQQFSYSTTDTLAVVKANGYFPNSGGANGMLGNFSPNDIISVVAEAPPAILTTQTLAPELSIIRIAGDGKNAGAATAVSASAGSSYTAGDLMRVVYTDGTVLRNTIIRANDATVSAPTIVDPGLFDTDDVPTALTGLAYANLDGSSGTPGTVTITTTGSPDITVWPKDIKEAV